MDGPKLGRWNGEGGLKQDGGGREGERGEGVEKFWRREI